MDTDHPDPAPQELIEAEISAGELAGPVAEKQVHDALDHVEGVSQVRIEEQKVFVVYDPMQVSKKELSEKLARSGHPVSGVKAERESPMA